MALNIKHDPEQWQQLIQAIADLSTNIGKQQALTTKAVAEGFAALVGSATEEQQQALINQLASNLKISTDEVEAAIKQSQPEKEIE